MSEETKEIANVDDALAAALAQSTELQAKENSEDGVKADYILLAKQGTKALDPNNKDLFIDGLGIGCFFLQRDKVNLGRELKVVPLAFITLYQEKESMAQDAKILGVWNKEQATQYPLCEGSYFNRELPDGHILSPVNWVMVRVIDHPEIKNPVIVYKSTGSRIWRAWKDDAKTRSGSCATLIYTIKSEAQSNANYKWSDIGFEYTANLIETDKVMALDCLKASNAIRESYNNHTLVADRVMAVEKASTKEIASDEIADSDDTEELGF